MLAVLQFSMNTSTFNPEDLPGYDEWVTEGVPCIPDVSINEEEDSQADDDWDLVENHRSETRHAKNFVAKVF